MFQVLAISRHGVLKQEGVFRLMTRASFSKYSATYASFCREVYKEEFSNAPPTEDQFMTYFQSKHENGYSAKTMWSQYSYLNKIMLHAWNFR